MNEDDPNNKRPIFNKYTTEKKLPVFDKNLTIEKAKFEGYPVQSTSTPTLEPTLTTSVTLPSVASTSTPVRTTKAKAEDRRAMKRKKLSQTATPSEVFHRNLVDAVSNVEDSDENEQYVYPYSGNTDVNDGMHRTTSSSLYRPQSTKSLAYITEDPPSPTTKTNLLGDLLRPIFKAKSTSSLRPYEEPLGRPKLRNFVMDHSTDNGWFSDGTPIKRHSNKRMYANYHDGGYTTDDEEQQHLLPSTIPYARPCSRWIKNAIMLLLFLCLLLFVLMTYVARPLQDIQVAMGRVLGSDKELIFDLHLHAINPNMWTARIVDADMSVFAFSQVVPMFHTVDPAEYLGGFYHFDEPLLFASSFYSGLPVTAISDIHIKSPGADKSGNERWSRMIRYPYGLVVRGVLKYKPLGFLSPYPQSIAICNVVRVDPTTGKVSDDPDQGYCFYSV
ncbi:uncharacterized protein B0P05DRAFT_589098 [Gilbertella persicaria]|uniref:uncharacterized protein n=1 Tax=Gilbertella persicaria TaxID=101096 RepID=UPI002220BED5|nr:uncharacterized protein B0P05DRAFT_589098 [Gilbertella persicaria]KAI8070569.1 hypothetical protein B0P05DRAFT_589098 [Gilbertella persicaria]